MQNKITLILGQKGSGKTTLARQMVQKENRLVILDPLHEYREGLIVTSHAAMREALELSPRCFRLVVRFEEEETNDRETSFPETRLALRDVRRLGPVTLLAEEVDWFCTPQWILPEFSWLIKYGRHNRVNILAVTRRPAETSIFLRSASDEIISFQQSEPADIDYLTRRGFPASELAELKPYSYLTKSRKV